MPIRVLPNARRRKFLMGMGALFAAPAIVRVASLMPVRATPQLWEGPAPFYTFARYSGFDTLTGESGIYDIHYAIPETSFAP